MASSIIISTKHGKMRLLYFPSPKPAGKKLLCIHGYCCDARIFAYLGKELSERGFDVYSIDLFGHGQSDGPKGDLDFDKTIEALDEVIAQIRGKSCVFLLGHSLGCTYALWYARNFGRNIDGLILMATYIRIPGMNYAGAALPSIPKFLWLYLARCIVPDSRVSATKVVRDAVLRTSEVRHMMADPEINYCYSYRYIIDVLANKNKDARLLADISVPVLLLHGKNDKNVLPAVSEEFYKLLKSKRKSIQLLDCDHWFGHAVFYNQDDSRYHEEDRAPVIDSIASWLYAIDDFSRKE